MLDDVKLLKATWHNLVLFNYEVPAELLLPYVPFGTELDMHHDKCYLSLMGFLWKDATVLKLKIPFHQKFEEIDFRFYVKRLSPEGYTRGVSYLREMVPSPVIATSANFIYGENYKIAELDHEIERDLAGMGQTISVKHKWKLKNDDWNFIFAKGAGDHFYAAPNSVEEFIVQRNKGYSRFKDGKTMEYEVSYPKWRLWPILQYSLHISNYDVFGEEFTEILQKAPSSVIMAEGSPVEIKTGKFLN